MESFGLQEKTVSKIITVLVGHPNVEKCVVYGSRAMGNYRPASDIDLTLFGEKLSLSELLKIENELDDLLLPYKIDLSLYQHIKDEGLKDHIVKKGKVFYEKVLLERDL